MFSVVAGLAILAVVLIGVVWRPHIFMWKEDGLPVFIPAMLGAVIALILGLVGLSMLGIIVGRVWDASFTLVGLFMLSAALDANNFFEWAALSLAWVAKGTPWKLYILMCLLTIAVTIFLGNDGAILGMTAIVGKLVKRTFPNNKAIWWPYLFATGFLADAFSGFLVPDNLTNIIVASTYHLPFVLFLIQMSLPMVLAASVTIICFAIRFRRVLFADKAGYDVVLFKNPRAILENEFIFKVSLVALFILILGHLVIGGVFHQPVSFVVLPVALVMLAFVRRLRSPAKILRAAPWEVLLYALSMFVVITAAMTPPVINTFLAITPLHTLILGQKSLLGVFAAGGLLAVLSALTNNLPATLVGILLLGTVAHPHMLAIYAVILGVDIGPKLTPYGSLATLLWIGILKREGIKVSWGHFIRENSLIAALALAAALIGLHFVVQ